jgi:hypothetical protein
MSSNNNYTISYNENKSFVILLNSLFEIVDGLASNEKINSGEYNELSMNIKNLYNVRETIIGNSLYKKMYHRSTTRPPVQRKTEEQKLMDLLNNEKTSYIVCEDCDTILVKDSIYNHKNTKKCMSIRQSKCGAIYKKKIVSRIYVKQQVLNHQHKINLEKNESKLKEQTENDATIFDSHYNWERNEDGKWIIGETA